MDLNAHINGVLALAPSEEAVEFEGRWHPWGELSAAKTQVEKLLDEAEISAGGRVAILLRNRPEIVPAVLAVVATGRCLVTLNPSLPDEALAADLARSEVPVLIGTGADLVRPGIAEAAREAGALCLRVEGGQSLGVSLVAGPHRTLWKRPAAEGVAVEMLSSGTTGAPKRIPLSVQNFQKSMEDYQSYESDGGGEPKLRSGVQILNSPFSHIGGLGRLMMAVVSGRKMCLLERLKLEPFVDAISRHKPKVTSGPPAVLKMILDADVPAEALESLRAFRVGTAPLDPDLADAFFDRYGIAVLQNYGATEFGGGVAGWSMPDYKKYRVEKRGSVGRISPSFEGRIVDETSFEVLPAGETGLLELRSDNINNGAWVRTTDLAVIDSDGFLFIRGRADGAIIRGGFKVLPEEIIRVLDALPAVKEATVIGRKDDRLGQVPVALVVPHDSCSEDGLRAAVKEKLLPYQVPTRFHIVEQLPRTASMKVDQRAVHALLDRLEAAQPSVAG
ncbi:class I adenylate-forming enzyme family protein [Paracoccus sp. J55]|uniref:class I adenylate-forming enzyme family protein n=1 Tax=Paracoccus sp. J55 TaxID=935849 RepID=UPI0004AF3130|nr:class I adenylate-forming enzyme family protein [Paracoccus sp. J55]